MKISNLERVVRAKSELENLNKAIKDFDKFYEGKKVIEGHIGFNIAEHTDCSGACVKVQYKNGNYHPMYAEILAFAKAKMECAKIELLAEIESL